MKRFDRKDLPFTLLNTAFMLLVMASMIYPFWYVLVYSLSESSWVPGGLFLFPRRISLDAFRVCLRNSDVLNGLMISTLRAVIGSAAMVVVSSMAAYAISKERLVAVRFFRRYLLFSMYVVAGLIPTYFVMKSLGLTNTFSVYILPGMANVFNIILIRAYMESLPQSIEESAHIDGANDFQIFLRIVTPMCKPVLAAVILYTAVGQWNAYIDTQIYNYRNPKLYPLQYVLYNYMAAYTPSKESAMQKVSTVTPQSIKMAVTIIAIVPILLVYPMLQRYFISGLLVGAVKD